MKNKQNKTMNLTAINNLTKSGEWAISDRGFMNYVTRCSQDFHSAIGGETDNVREALSYMFNQRQPMQVNDGFASIHVYGALLQDASPIDLAMGNTGYEEIISDIKEAESDNSIHTILFNIDSPGGMVSGMLEAANAINSTTKRTACMVEGHATSAAYALSSQCDIIAASASSTSGNIGTVLSWSDISKYYEAIGVTNYVMTNDGADLKGTFIEFPMSDSQKDFLQNRINQHGDEFWQLVTSNRPQIDEECKRAGWYQPEDAGRLGLIDMEATKEEFIGYLSENIDTV